MSLQGPIDERLVGQRIWCERVELTRQLAMGYAACIGEDDDLYLDDRAADRMVAHPLLAAVLPQRLALTVPVRLAREGVSPSVFSSILHYDQRIRYERPLPVDCTIEIVESIVSTARTPRGTYLLLRYAASVDGDALFTADMGLMLLGVDRDLHAPPPAESAVEPGRPLWRSRVPVNRCFPYVYEACTAVPAPIHTSRAAAERAGFSDIVVQGTATLALAVREIMKRLGSDAVKRLTALEASFRRVIHADSELVVELLSDVSSAAARQLSFQVLAQDGAVGVRGGVKLRPGVPS